MQYSYLATMCFAAWCKQKINLWKQTKVNLHKQRSQTVQAQKSTCTSEKSTFATNGNQIQNHLSN